MEGLVNVGSHCKCSFLIKKLKKEYHVDAPSTVSKFSAHVTKIKKKKKKLNMYYVSGTELDAFDTGKKKNGLHVIKFRLTNAPLSAPKLTF